METWFLNHALGLSLSVLLLGLPGGLGAGTPSNTSSDPSTAGFHHSTASDELSSVENNATATSYSSESLSPSQRNLLLTHSAETHTAAAASASPSAGSFDTEQTQTSTETSSGSLETSSLSTEPLISTLVVVATTEASSSISSSSSTDSSTNASTGSSSGSSSNSRSSSSTDSSTNASTGSSSSSSRSRSRSISTDSSTSVSIGSSSSSSSRSRSRSRSSSTDSSTSASTGSSSSSGSTNSSSTRSSTNASTSSSSSSSSSIDSSTSASTGSSSSIGSSTSTSTSSSTSGSTSSSSRKWEDSGSTDKLPDISQSVSWEARTLTERMLQDSPDSTLWQDDTTALASQTDVHTDSTYTSTTISRAGERTLLSVTSSSSSNSTSAAFTEESNSYQPPSTWGVPASAPGTEDYTHTAPSTRTDSRETTDQHMTHSFKRRFPETGSPGEKSRGTQSSTGPPNGTQQQHTSESEETSDSTPPLRVTELSTDQSKMTVSSTPPITSAAGGPTNVSGTDVETDSSVGTSTEASSAGHSSSTQNQKGTEGLSTQTGGQSTEFGLTAAPPTVSSNTSEMDEPLTDTPLPVTELFLTTTPVPATDRSQMTEEDTFKASTSTTTTTPPPPITSAPRFSSTTSSFTSESHTEPTVPSTAAPTTASTAALQTSAARPTHRAASDRTQGPSTHIATPTKVTTMRIETTGTLRADSRYVTTTYTPSTPTRSTELLHTTGKQTDRGTTELVVTTSPTDIQPTLAPPPLPPPGNPCVSNPCMNGGTCMSYEGPEYTCRCQQAWTGPNCNQDLDECERDPCPQGSRCVNTRGSFSCECPLGFDLEDGRTCTRAKTFLGTFIVTHDPVIFKSVIMHEIQREIIQLLNASLSVYQGYSRSTLSKKEENGFHILAINMFSISTDVTSAEVNNTIQMFLRNCNSSVAHCPMASAHLSRYQLTYHVESLCAAQKTQCDMERSTCTDTNGTAYCQCLQGYYKHNPDDLSCLECGDGYKLENGTCVPCMFGFGGFNCGNFYKLIAVVVSPAGGALLLILIIALIVTCCKKDKNDINKIIFKSGDLQMSPYADFPKNNRISMEWGRETIEMQENGSTKNLLQMTDIYYSPALRNSDLERNGLYPFTGLPGSRHSCIYPAQWNPSFISDDSRRRDYF